MSVLVELYKFNLQEVYSKYSEVTEKIDCINKKFLELYPEKTRYEVDGDCNNIYIDDCKLKSVRISFKGLSMFELIDCETCCLVYKNIDSRFSLVELFNILSRIKNCFSSEKEEMLKEIKNLSDSLYFFLSECIKYGIELLSSRGDNKFIIEDSDKINLSGSTYIKEISIDNKSNVILYLERDPYFEPYLPKLGKYVTVNSVQIDVLLNLVSLLNKLIDNKSK